MMPTPALLSQPCLCLAIARVVIPSLHVRRMSDKIWILFLFAKQKTARGCPGPSICLQTRRHAFIIWL
uniref:Putative secreted protein n=1 Tax=Anopheles darlingi TaxID=43151 RepID=A0A2M4DK84_ANODA